MDGSCLVPDSILEIRDCVGVTTGNPSDHGLSRKNSNSSRCSFKVKVPLEIKGSNYPLVMWLAVSSTYFKVRSLISPTERLLTGWGISTYGCPGMPFPRNWKIAAFVNARVTIVVDGMPNFSNSTVSCTLHNVHDPQPPNPAIATST